MYNDIDYVSYKKLRAQVTSNEEYKGPQGPSKLKQYPIGARKHSQRFFVEGPDGVFYVYYHNRMDFKGIAEEAGNEVCRIYPDNSLEFINFDWMSRQQYLGAMLGASVSRSSKHGGVVLCVYGAVLHPVFKGLRVDMTDAYYKARTPYTVDYRRLKQAAAKEELAKYAPFINIAPVLIATMSIEGIIAMYAEHQDATAVGIKTAHYTYYETQQGQLMGRVLKAIEAGHYVDAALLHSLHTGHPLVYRRPFGDANRAYITKESVMKALRTLLARFKDDMLRATPEVLKHIPRKEGAPLKTSKWGYDIRMVQADAFAGTQVVR